MNQRLVHSVLTHTTDFDPVIEYPEDIERLVAVATKGGYKLTTGDAAQLWRRHAGEACASGLLLAVTIRSFWRRYSSMLKSCLISQIRPHRQKDMFAR